MFCALSEAKGMDIKMTKRNFLVVIEQDEDGKYIASVPSLSGCHTQADDLVELGKRIQEVIKLYLVEKDSLISTPEKFIGIHQVEV